MKKKMLCLLLAALLLCAMLPQQAKAANVNDLTFTLNDDGKSYMVSGCDEFAEGALRIPATYQGKPVTGIDDEAFEYCEYLTSVTIPSGVTSIGDFAFCECFSLTSVVIPDSVTSIGEYAFADCSSLTAVTIPASVTNIGEDAFSGCSSLTSVTIPKGVTSIGKWAFNYCSSLTGIWVDVNNPNYSNDSKGVLFNKDRTILIQAPGALSGAYSIPSSVTNIGATAFEGCSSLTSVKIPNGVTSIGNWAFSDCSGLSSVTIPGSVTSIEWGAFSCTGLTSLTIPGSVGNIDDCLFESCSSLTSVYIPGSVTSIGECAFLDCSSLEDVYYGGSEQQWEQIDINVQNEPLTNATIHFNAHSVSDVELTSWQYTHVQYALERNLMAGKGTDADGRIKFDPNSSITREEFVQVLYNAEGKPAVDLLNPFPDVAENGWYKNAVLWAKKNDIANGGADGNFGIGARIIRQDLALMLYKYARLKNCSLEAQEGITDQFGDKDSISGYAKEAMDWAVTNGILSGKGVAGQPLSTFRLDPTGTATRAECAAMLRNFMTAFGL